MDIQPQSAGSIQLLLERETIKFTSPTDPVTQIVDLWIAGFVVTIIHKESQYVLTQIHKCDATLQVQNNIFIETIIERCKLQSPLNHPPSIQETSTILSIKDTLYDFFDTKKDYLYFTTNNSLVSFSDNLATAYRFSQEKINQLISKYALEKANHAKKAQIARSLQYDLHEYQVALYVPGMSWIGRLGKLIEPRLGNLHQYHSRDLKVPPCSLKKLAGIDCLPKISIVTPSFEQGRYLEKTIQSVLNQGYLNLEYIVKDGGSQDNSKEILQRYDDKLTYWTSEPDDGQAQAINIGFAHTTGDIMAWLNSDDLLLPGALCYVVAYFKDHPEVDVIYGNRLLITENDMEVGRWILPRHSNTILSWADFIPQETMFWRRSIWEKVGGKIDESFNFAMDWDLLIRFRSANAKFAHIPYFIGAFRVHEHQKTSASNDIGYIESKRIHKRIFGRIPKKSQVRRALLSYLILHLAADFLYRIKSRFSRKNYIHVFSDSEL